MTQPATLTRTFTLKAANLADVAASVREGELVYSRPESASYKRLVAELAELLAIRGLRAESESWGWLRVTRPRVLPVADVCAVVACGGRIQWGACRRCGTKP